MNPHWIHSVGQGVRINVGMFVKQDDCASAVVLDRVPRDTSPISKVDIIAWNKGMGLDILLRTRDIEHS
jgi:hypothetical protein